MAETRTLRASSMPLAMRCPGSVHPEPDEPLIDPHNEAGDMGSAVHEIMATIVREGLDYVPPVTPVAQRFGLDADELAGLSAAGLKCWRKIGHWLEDRIVEQEMSVRLGTTENPLNLTGHADVVGWHDDQTLIVIDWKTGRLDSDHYDQMAAYALLAREKVRAESGLGAERVIAVPVWVRDAEVEVYEFSRQQLRAHEQKIEDQILDWDGTYHPGPHCEHCPRFAKCPARRAMVRQEVANLKAIEGGEDEAVAALFDQAESDPAALDRIAELLDHAKAIGEIAERFRDHVKAQVRQRGGKVEGNEKRLTLQPQSRRYIKPRKAWGILEKYVNHPRELLDAVKFSVGDVMGLVGQYAPKRGKAARQREVDAELREAGALYDHEISPKLLQKRTDKAIEARSEG